jgi:membrane protein DedA with SNARE-associated domain
MSVTVVSHLILQYRYWALLVFSILEGPIVAFIAGTLASLGYFNIYLLALFFFARDMIMDGGYYALGHFGGRTRLARWFLHKIGVRQEHLDDVRRLWDNHPATTMFFGKLSYGIAASFIVVAGMVKMRLEKFFAYGALVAVLQYGVLLALGYFFGNSLGGKLVNILNNIQYVLIVLALVVVGYYIFTRFMRARILKNEERERENP